MSRPGVEAAAQSFRTLVDGLPRMPGRVRVDTGPCEGVVELVLDNPAKKNALTPHMMVELADAVHAVAGARVVILRGEGGTFCSGGDLDAVSAHLARPGGGRLLASFMSLTVDRLCTCGPAILGVLEGNALGGGAELLVACDLIVASPTARIGFVQARLGVSPGFGGGGRLVERLGPSQALRVLADAAPVPAAEAGSLVDEVTDDPLAHARDRAARWASLPPEALAGARRIVRAWSTAGAENARATEIDTFDALWGGAAHRASLDRAPRPRAR